MKTTALFLLPFILLLCTCRNKPAVEVYSVSDWTLTGGVDDTLINKITIGVNNPTGYYAEFKINTNDYILNDSFLIINKVIDTSMMRSVFKKGNGFVPYWPVDSKNCKSISVKIGGKVYEGSDEQQELIFPFENRRDEYAAKYAEGLMRDNYFYYAELEDPQRQQAFSIGIDYHRHTSAIDTAENISVNFYSHFPDLGIYQLNVHFHTFDANPLYTYSYFRHHTDEVLNQVCKNENLDFYDIYFKDARYIKTFESHGKLLKISLNVPRSVLGKTKYSSTNAIN